jgi:dTDP-4-amino-4,6-dideoxygalactose transaminase
LCTHHFGNPCEIEELVALARKHSLAVIEDCAHTLFTKRSGKYTGLFGDFGAFSFNHRKQLSTGQGGFLVINSEKYAEKSRDQGFGRVPARLSWNYAMPGVVAALALAQWEAAQDYVQRDHELAGLYSQAAAGCKWLTAQEIPAGNWCAYHIWAAVYTGDEAGIEYRRFMEALRANGADYFLPAFMPYGAFGLEPSPVYRYPLFNEPRAYGKGCPTGCPLYQGRADYSPGLCPNAERLVPRLLNTVLSPVEDDRVKRYADALHRTIAQFS